jgi:Na+-transporting methylmalonyl-CoA/oxaloacetate decarboxylase gamma subunit
MRAFSLLFVFIALVLLVQFLLFVSRGPVDTSFDTFVAGALFVGFLLCLIPALYLLKPFESREALRRRREARRTPEERPSPENDPPEEGS